MTWLLVLLVIVLAAAAGVLGELLEFAGWLLLTVIVVGGVAGWALYAWVRRTLHRALH